MSPVMLAIASTPEIARISDVNWAHQRSGLPAGRAMCAWSSDGAAKPATTSVKRDRHDRHDESEHPRLPRPEIIDAADRDQAHHRKERRALDVEILKGVKREMAAVTR